METYPELFRLFEELGESLCGLHTDGVSSEMDLLDGSGVEVREVRLDICAGIQLQTTA